MKERLVPMRGLCLVFFLLALIGQASSAHAAAKVRYFYADLVSDEETFPVESKGKGHAELTLDLETLRLSWTVTFSGLTSKPTAVKIHGPAQMFTNGVPVVDMAPKGVSNPLRGSAVIEESLVQYILSTWAYINISTERYKDGEIRGQIDGKGLE
jgi:hypothetical protein